MEKWGMRENLNKDILWFIGKKESHEKLKKNSQFFIVYAQPSWRCKP